MTSRTNEILLGAAAGVIATIPMTYVMEELHRVMPREHDGPLPPREVTEGLYEHFTDAEEAEEEDLQRLTFLLHYSFGGAAGALFPIVAPRRVPAADGAGVLYGLAVWTGSYLGWLPAIGVRHHARHDPAGRTAMMIAAHVAWGATLGLLLRGRPGLRTASRHPDRPDASVAQQPLPLARG
jgi:uncharacterized membrane protein YagU involved in acid resistance